jgi:hypothetical protein
MPIWMCVVFTVVTVNVVFAAAMLIHYRLEKRGRL